MKHTPAATATRPLDWLNFLLADVQSGLGPFLAIYVVAAQGWDAGTTGVALSVGGIATVVARPPLGALVDRVRSKRGLIVGAAAAVAGAVLVLVVFPTFWPVAAAQAVSGVADAAFPPAVAAITLGLVGRRAYSARVGRNEAFNHAGNAVTAVVGGLAGWLFAQVAVLWIVAALSLASIAAVLAIDPRRIDHQQARGGDGEGPSGIAVILGCRPLLAFTVAATLFHLANAAMLPLLGETLEKQHGGGTLFIAACIVTAQAVMVPTALAVGRHADTVGRKPLFLVGFLVLPVRGILYTLTTDPVLLVAIQVLDGIGAGIFGALFLIVVEDLTQGTGRYNLALGAVAACWGLGAAVSNGAAGIVAAHFGYNAAFLSLAGIAAGALAVFWAAVPETRADV